MIKLIKKTPLQDSLLLTLGISILFGFLLGTRPLNVPDEARYCEIAREMLVSHDFITPHFNGIKYFEKPILFYWMQALALNVGGLNEWSCRFVNALMALIGCLAVYGAGYSLFDRKAGLWAASVLATSFLYFIMARVVTLDMTVSVYLTLSLLSFLSAIYTSAVYYYIFFVFAACAVLTKGLIGIVFPAAIILVWACFTRQYAWLLRAAFWKGMGVFFILVLPWHIAVQIKNPEFFHFYFIEQHFRRYLTLEAHRYEPSWYYLPVFFAGFYPWTGFLYGAMQAFFKKLTFFSGNVHRSSNVAHKKLPENSRDIYWFFIISAVFIFAFFAFSKSKLVPYILPCFPFLALLTGVFFSETEKITADNPDHPKNETFCFYGKTGLAVQSLTSLLVALIIFIFLYRYHHQGSDKIILFNHATVWFMITAGILITHALASLVLSYRLERKKFQTVIMTQLVFSALFLGSACQAAQFIYMGSVKNIAHTLKKLSETQNDGQHNYAVATYDYYYQDLPFYLAHEVKVVNWEGELKFGKAHTPHQINMIEDTAFKKLWENKNNTLFVVLPQALMPVFQNRFSDQPFYSLSHTPNDVLITNQKP